MTTITRRTIFRYAISTGETYNHVLPNGNTTLRLVRPEAPQASGNYTRIANAYGAERRRCNGWSILRVWLGERELSGSEWADICYDLDQNGTATLN